MTTLHFDSEDDYCSGSRNVSLSKDYLHPDNHAKQITDTPGFKPFTISEKCAAQNGIERFL